jgi:ABC-type nitrate/sulfonate/bicarbonate transport system substrate-binding protein
MERRSNRLWAVIICLLLVAVGNPALAQEKKNVRMVFVSLAWNSEIPFRAALARGFFKQQGLQVEPILIRGGPAAIAALVSGEVDFAAIGGAQYFAAARAAWICQSSVAPRARRITSYWGTSRRGRWKISKAR